MFEQHFVTTALVCPAYLVVILVGSVGNGLLIYYYLVDKSIHRTFNLLVTHLAGADFIMCALFTPLLFAYRVHEPARLLAASPLCELSIFFSSLSISMMYCLFPLLAYHRKDVMLRPRSPKLSLAQATRLVLLFWLFCAVVSGFMVGAAWKQISNDDDATPKLFRCILVNTKVDAFSVTFLIYAASLYGASILFTVVTYVGIFRVLSSQEAGVNGTAEERRNTKLCLWVGVVYSTCWTPFLLVQLAGIFGAYSNLHFNLHAASSVVGVLASAINPAIYASMDPYYRRKFAAICSPFRPIFPTREIASQ